MKAEQLSQIVEARARVLDEARPEAVELVHAAGHLTARERIAALVDEGSFIEYGQLAGESPALDDQAPADGLVAGSGQLDGGPLVVASYDVTVHDGTQTDRNMRKLVRLLYLANRHRWPFVCFVDGDGARPDPPLAPPPIVVYSRGTWDVYEGLAELSGWAPSVAIISGRALDGNAGLAMMCDLVVATAGSEVGARGPDGQPVTRPVEELAADGSVDVVVDDETEAIAVVADYLNYWAGGFGHGLPSATHDTITSIIPDDRRAPYDVRDVMAAVADADSTLELGARWAPSMITMLATLGGRPIGLFANQPSSPVAGAIDSAAADKAARFVELCDAYEFPLVSLVDNPGYMVGPDAERAGIARHHARPLAALHHRTVPLCSVQLRKAYGLGPWAMSGWGSSRIMPELRLAWPSVESGGMSLEGAAYLVKRREIKAAESPEEARAIRDAYAEEMRDPASGVSAGRTFSFDDIVLPSETRDRIIAVLETIPRVFPPVKKHPIDPR
ncbi:MAG: biotin carboxylase [Actinomycetota bacterium]|jgi:acetyl-CoA carboxylase carboxyltransferase component|nr:biotin carboxylase [Actinomycetota bacterium]